MLSNNFVAPKTISTKVDPRAKSPVSSKLSEFKTKGPRSMTHVPQIQVKLDENNNKRQNVQFLKNLLDQQLNALVSNLTAIQNNNSAIELETI